MADLSVRERVRERSEFRAALDAAGLVDVEIRPTHRVHTHAASAIVRARKP
jgi:arsenite methyltransferase